MGYAPLDTHMVEGDVCNEPIGLYFSLATEKCLLAACRYEPMGNIQYPPHNEQMTQSMQGGQRTQI